MNRTEVTVPILRQPINCTQLPGHNPSPSLAKVVQAAIVGANQRDNDKFLPAGMKVCKAVVLFAVSGEL
jgi:hypothetical protein